MSRDAARWGVAASHLNGGWPKSKQLVSGSFSVAVHVDQNVDSILVNAIGSFSVAWDLDDKNKVHVFQQFC